MVGVTKESSGASPATIDACGCPLRVLATVNVRVNCPSIGPFSRPLSVPIMTTSAFFPSAVIGVSAHKTKGLINTNSVATIALFFNIDLHLNLGIIVPVI
jgi:hypothetical protein